MKTVEELEAEYQDIHKLERAAWEEFQTAEKVVKPLNDKWYRLYQQQQKLSQVLEWRKEMEVKP